MIIRRPVAVMVLGSPVTTMEPTNLSQT